MRKKILLSLLSLFLVFATGAFVASSYVISVSEELDFLLQLHKVDKLRSALVSSIGVVQGDLFAIDTPRSRNMDTIIRNVQMMEAAAEGCTDCHHELELTGKFTDLDNTIHEYKKALSYYLTGSANSKRISRLGRAASEVGERLLLKTEEVSIRASSHFSTVTKDSLERLANVKSILLATFLVMFILALFLSRQLISGVTGPIDKLVEGTRRIASGELGYEVPTSSVDEFKELSGYFNEMSTSLKAAYKELEENNDVLKREISERQQAEQERNRLMDQLVHARKLEAVGTLSGGISHEFNNMLQVIQGSADLLSYSIPDEGQNKKHLETIISTANRGGNLTKRLLAFSRKAEGDVRPIDLNQSLKDIHNVLVQTLPREIEINLYLADEELPVLADPSTLEQVALNLAINSKDAMPNGGKITLRTRWADEGECPAANCNEGKDGKCIVWEMADEGHGMDELTCASVFDPFFTTKDVGQGTGLGLSVTYGIITGLGGTISCKSKVGEGTTFTICLPALDKSRLTVNGGEETPSPLILDQPHSGSILIADDEVGIAQSAGLALTNAGYKVYTAKSGEEALGVVEREDVALVLLDLGMPGMGGRSCLAKLVELGEKMPEVIVSTGYALDEDERQHLLKNARAILGKPYRLDSLFTHVEEAFVDIEKGRG